MFARTSAMRDLLRGSFRKLVPRSLQGDRFRWWTNADAGLTMLLPDEARPLGKGSFAILCSGRETSTRWVFEAKGGASDVTDPSELRGSFALARWDERAQELLLARDQLGQSALFLLERDGFLFFSSAIRPLLEILGGRREMDLVSAVHYLAFGLPAPGRSLVKSIQSLPAGHCLSCRPGRANLPRRYFTALAPGMPKVPNADQRAEISTAFIRAVSASLGAGRQALLLSGGVDSSFIASAAGARGAEIDAYTVEFTGCDFPNEGDIARAVADRVGARHHRVELDVADAERELEATLGAVHPQSAWAAITHAHLLKRIGADGHRRLFSGLGADEVFGGYSSFLAAYKKMQRLGVTLPAAADPVDAAAWDPRKSRSALFAGVPRFLSRADLRRALARPYSDWEPTSPLAGFYHEARQLKPDAHLFEMMVSHECQHRVPDLLFASFEPSSSRLGLETHYPFLDPDVVTRACALGATERFWIENGRWRNKKLLRELAAEGGVPDFVLSRRPVSYNAPIGPWLRGKGFSERIMSALEDGKIFDLELFDPAWMDELRGEALALRDPDYRSPKEAVREHVWIVATLASWYDTWIGGSLAEDNPEATAGKSLAGPGEAAQSEPALT
jgi:asparagine synthase (glutamine-hydrolysing)